MMLSCPERLVVPVTVHLPLREAVDRLRTADIVHCARVTAEALRQDFAVSPPRLAVAALHPHAGEHDAPGLEEIEVRSEDRRVGTEYVSTCRSRRSPPLYKKTNQKRQIEEKTAA